ncbi:MAG: hypothetical protein N2170_06645 [Bacteroidia bacterium]|nr:hypothetical protein [Bacteroidia bacterium]
MPENRAVLYLADGRSMAEIPSESIALVITSPPYWHIKRLWHFGVNWPQPIAAQPYR